MSMSENKTQANENSIIIFLETVENKRRRDDAEILIELFKKVTGHEPVMWGSSIVGYGTYTYKLANGKQEMFLRSGFHQENKI